MKLLILGLTILLTAWIQISFFGHIRPLGVMPNLMLVLVVVAALWLEATPALAGAVVAGFIMDLASGADFGLRTAFYAAAALGTIAARQFGLHTESLFTAAAIVLLATILFNGAILLNLGQGIIDWPYVGRKLAAESVVNVVLIMTAFLARSLLLGRRARIRSELNRRSWL